MVTVQTDVGVVDVLSALSLDTATGELSTTLVSSIFTDITVIELDYVVKI